MTTDDKTPADRPAPKPSDIVAVAPRDRPDDPDGPRALAAYVKQLPTREHIEGMEREIGTVLDRLAALEPLGAAHGELASTVEAQGAELAAVHQLLNEIASEIASATRTRSAQRTRDDRQLPSAAAGAVPGLELPAELQVDVSKPGTQITQLPGGGILEINVRRPPANDAPKVIRDGKPVVPTKVRRS